MRLGLLALAVASVAAQTSADFSVLVFTRTTGFRHGSIPDGIAAVQKLGADNGFAVVATEDPAQFTEPGLARFRVVVFLNTTGDVLNDTQQAAFEQFIRNGGGFVGVHSATDTEYEWPFYGRLVGTYFKSHPEVQPAQVRVVDRTDISTRRLPEVWQRTDEWYNFRSPLSPEIHVLASLDESSYHGGEMGAGHPISWFHEFEGGRAWYTGMGHTEDTFREPEFLMHLLGGIRAAAGFGDERRSITGRPRTGRKR